MSAGVRGVPAVSTLAPRPTVAKLTRWAAGALLGAATLLPACTSERIVGVDVDSVNVSPSSATLLVGETRSFSAQARDDGGEIVPATATWSSSDGAVLSVTPEGLAEALAPGQAEVRATVDGVTGSASVTVEAGPTIEASPEGVSLFAAAAGDSPDAAEVAITNAGSGNLTGLSAAVEDVSGPAAGWLSVALSSSSAPATLLLTAATTSLAAGEYAAVVRVASASATNSPLELPVELSVVDDQAILRLVPAAVGFAAVRGGAAPSEQEVSVQNVGGGEAGDLSVEVGYTDAGGWLTATLAADTAPTQIELVVDLGTLAAGTYQATVDVASPDAINSPVRMAVTLSIEAEPRADLSVVKSGPEGVAHGDTVEFVLTVANAGPGRARDAVLIDSLPGGFSFEAASSGGEAEPGVVTWNLGDLMPGDTVTETLRAVAVAENTWQNIARVHTTTLDTVPDNDRHVLAVVIGAQPANLTMSKAGPTIADHGDTIDYVLTTANLGPGPATSLIVTDSLPTGLTFLSASAGGVLNGSAVTWSSDTLDAGATRVDTVTVRVDATGSFTDVARATSASPDPVNVNNRATLTTSVDRVADVSLTKTGPDTVSLGDTIRYVLTTSNAGPDTATAVVPMDSLPAGLTFVSASGGGSAAGSVVTWPASSLAPGASRVDTVRARADATGTLTDVARVSLSTADPDSADRRATFATLVRASALSIAKTAPNTAESGDTIIYVLTLHNAGPDDAPGVQMRDTLPSQVGYLSATGAPSVTGNVLVWNKGLVSAGTTLVDTVRAVANASGEAVNVARVSGGLGSADLPGRRATTTTTILASGLSLTKTASLWAFGVNYRITLSNAGPGRATKITVLDSLPSGPILLSATGSPTVGAGTLTWTRGALPAGASLVFDISMLSLGGQHTNVVRANAESGGGGLRASATSGVGGADLSVTKSGPANATLGDTLTYVIVTSNAGPQSAVDVSRTDSLPPGVTFVSATRGGTLAGTVVTWPTDTLSSGVITTDTVKVVANTIGTKTNVVRVSSPTADPDEDDRRATAVTTVASADLTVTKSAPASAEVGDTIEYVLAGGNAGPSSATSVMLLDSLPPGVTFVSATGGGTLSGSVVTWNKGTLENGATFADTVRVVPTTVGSKTNIGRLTSPVRDPVPGGRRSTVVTEVTQVTADLSVTKTAPATVETGDTIVYVLQVNNAGPDPAASVTLRDSLPASVTFVSATGGGSLNGTEVTWSKGTLATGVTTHDTLRVLAGPLGSQTNIARVASPTFDPDTGDRRDTAVTEVTEVMEADLSVSKTGPAFVAPTGAIQYQLEVTNAGPNTAASVTLVDSLPAGVLFVSASDGGILGGTRVTWSLGNLASGGTATRTLDVTSTTAGTKTNVARVSSATTDPDTTNQRATVQTSATSADLSLAKTGPASVQVDDTIDYVLAVTNSGPHVAASVTLVDSLPAGVTFVSATGGGTLNGDGTAVNWGGASLASGAQRVETLRVVANTTGSKTNRAWVSSPTFDPDVGDRAATFVTDVTDPPSPDPDASQMPTGAPSTTTSDAPSPTPSAARTQTPPHRSGS